jgi:hypothetical protein
VGQEHDLRIPNKSVERVANFGYLAMPPKNADGTQGQIKQRLNSGKPFIF